MRLSLTAQTQQGLTTMSTASFLPRGPERIRTFVPQLRRLVLYPVEPQIHECLPEAQRDRVLFRNFTPRFRVEGNHDALTSIRGYPEIRTRIYSVTAA